MRGNLKSIASYERLKQSGLYPNDQEGVAEQRLRLIGEFTKGPLRLEIHDQISYFAQTTNTPFFSLPNYNPTPAWISTWNVVNQPNQQLIQQLDRANLQLSLRDVVILVGKQVISTGVGHLFQAVSQVPRLPFVLIDPEYPFTEDAASVTWKGPFVLEARFLPKTRGQQNHNFHIRAKGSKGGYDMALTAGRSDDKVYVGLETAGNIGDSLLRAEIVGYNAALRDYVQGLIGLDTVFSPKFSGEIEFFYNGFGSRTPYLLTPLLHRPAPYRGLWYGGGHLTWDPGSRLKIQLLAIVNLLDPSILWNLTVGYSLASNLDLTLGQFLGTGSRSDSEFGGRIPSGFPGISLGLPDLTYLELKWSF